MDWKALLGRKVEKVGFSKFAAALSKGVPPALRPQVWLSFSGAGERLRAQPTLYAELVARCDGDGDGCRGDVRDQIEKDLRRTEIGPGSPSTSSKVEPISAAKVESLRRVLLAFASFNPDVSYVQGMNFIAAGLLATLPEDASFWMLVLIVEQWLPGHFGPRMMGNHVDCRVLGLLTTQHLPRLADGLKSLEVSTQLLTARWFLCFWASVQRRRAIRPAVRRAIRRRAILRAAAHHAPRRCCHPTRCSDLGRALRAGADGDAAGGVGVHALGGARRRRRARHGRRPRGGEGAAARRLRRPASRRHLPAHGGPPVGHTARWVAQPLPPPRLRGARAAGREAPPRQAAARLRLLVAGGAAARPALRPRTGVTRRQRRGDGRRGDPGGRLHVPASALRDGAVVAQRLRADRPALPPLLARAAPAEAPTGDDDARAAAAADAAGGGARRRARRRRRTSAAAPTRWSGSAPAARRRRQAGEAARRDSSPPNRQHDTSPTLSDEQARSAEQLAGGAAVLRGTSARRAELCFRCFDVDETGEVPRHHFLYLLRGMYLLYEPPLDENPDAEAATLARVSEEAEQFTRMMYELWDERGTGCLTAAQFDRAAHQHPLLVQAFALEAMETPAALATPPPSPAGPPPPRRPRTEMGSELLCADEHSPEVVH